MRTETFRLSSRQISLLNEFASKRRSISLIECIGIDQRTFGSLLRQELIAPVQDDAFSVTPKGRAIFKAYLNTDIMKDTGSRFSPTVQVLISKTGIKAKVIQMAEKAVATAVA